MMYASRFVSVAGRVCIIFSSARSEGINEMDEDEKKLLISQLAKREGLPYNPDNKHDVDIYFADKDEESTFADAIYLPNRGAFWGSLEKDDIKSWGVNR